MAGQDFISLGIDTSQFSADKEAVLARFVKLFEQLSVYDGKVFNPVLGGGLIEFNNSITATSNILNDLNAKLTTLTSALNGTSGGSSKASSSAKALTAETAKLKVELAEANRLLLENAKAQNASVQARQKAAKAAAEEKEFEKLLALEQKENAAAVAAAQKKAAQEATAAKKAQAIEEKRLIAEQKSAEREAEAQRKQIEKDRRAAEQRQVAADKQRLANIKQNELAQKQQVKAEQEEALAVQRLANTYDNLKRAQKEQIANYANALIASNGNQKSTAVINARKELEATSSTLTTIDRQVEKSSGSVNRFGRSLTSAFGGLRTLAYILPGIGIAGLFNLAFEAIGKAADELGLFNGQLTQAAEREKVLNDLLKNQFDLFNNIFEKVNSLDAIDKFGKKAREQGEELFKTRGGAKDISGPIDVKLSQDRATEEEKNMKSLFGSEQNINRLMDKRLKEVGESAAKLKKLNDIERAITDKKAHPESDLQVAKDWFADDEKQRKALRASTEAELALNTEKFELLKKTAEKYYDSINDLETKKAILFKFNADQERQAELERTKSSISVLENKNEIELAKEINGEERKVKAIEDIRKNKVSVVQADLKSQIDNTETTLKERITAEKKAADAIFIINAEAQDKTNKLRENYRQQRLDAQESIDKSIVNEEAVKNERIFKNENKSLDERLTAYINYVNKRQEKEEIEFKREIDVLSLKTGDKTAQKKIEELNQNRITEKANDQADVEKQVYDIVYTSTQKQLKLVVDENKIEEDARLVNYTNALNNLNNSFRNKEISYRKYNENRKKIDHDYEEDSLNLKIQDDKRQLSRLQNYFKDVLNLREQARVELDSANFELDFASKNGGDVPEATKKRDKAQGKFDALTTATNNTELAVKKSQRDLDEDENKRARLKFEEDTKNRRRWAQAVKQIEQSLYNTIKELTDKDYQYKLNQLGLKKALIDEQYGYEIAAVQKSTLTSKDKAALDVQLNAQKRQQDETIAREEKRIKHDQAVFDRDIAIAHIILSTAEAVASALEFPPLAIAAGVAGAAELVIASNVKIPAYAKGIKSTPRDEFARIGEDGIEVVKQPYKSPYLVMSETISYLPKGTEVIPIKDSPVFGEKAPNDNWEQTRWLAKQLKKSQPINKTTNNINIDLGFELYKHKVLYG